MNPWQVVLGVFLVVAGVAYVLLSLWAGRKAQEFRGRIKKYTGTQ